MNYPHCQSKSTRKITKKTFLGYEQYRCSNGGKQYNEHSGTKVNFIKYPAGSSYASSITTVFKVSFDEVVQLMAMRGFYLSHQGS